MIRTILLLAALAVACFGQRPETAPPAMAQVQGKYYRFEFAVKEVGEGKVLNVKNYSVIGSSRGREQIVIRAGEKVPIHVSGGVVSGTTTFMDVGVNVDCRISSETATDIGLSVSADISAADTHVPPVISQTKWNSNVIVPLKKATTIFSSESPTKKVQTQLEVTVTPLQ